MNRKAYLATVFIGLALALGVVGGARAQSGGPVAQEGVGLQAALGTGFTYQGQLKSSGSPVNGSCTFGIGLWDSASGGVQLGVTQTVTTTVTNGLFTVALNDSAQFGGSAFSGSNARYLGIGVKCGSESSLTSLGRQALTAAPYALYARNNWGLNGNSGTSASNFLGTTDNMTLTLAVSNTAILRLVPNATSPNLIGGYSGNSVSAGVSGATIGGGGSSGFTNDITGTYGTIGGGQNNTAGGTGTVGGGFGNTAGSVATVGGGDSNTASGFYATIGGGVSSLASGQNATVGGGNSNTASGNYAVVGGGFNNTASGDFASVSGGSSNIASGSSATVGGGVSNTASNSVTTVSGGELNTASGQFATAAGGYGNTASGSYSFAAGRNARAINTGAFVWADNSTTTPISSTATNQFVVRASNGFSLSVNAGGSKVIDVGEHYRDNAIVAWGKVTGSTGAISADFGVASVVRNSAGNYTVTLDATAASAAELVPIANAEVDTAPSSAATARLIWIDQQSTTQFGVYITNGNYAATDNDFTFIVTGR